MADIEEKLEDLLRRAQAEVADVDLFAPPPPNEDCPICLQPYPHDESLSIFQSCCGQLICAGCMWEILAPKNTCALCRAPTPRRLNHYIKAVEKHLKKQNPRAFMFMADAYKKGEGVPRNERRALEIYTQAAKLGHPEAYLWIGNYYHCGLVVAQDRSKCRAFVEVAAKKGCAASHHNLAEFDEARGDVAWAIQHYKVAACAGLQPSLNALMRMFKDHLLPKEELEHCLRAFQEADENMKSKGRAAFDAFFERKKREG